MDKEIKNCAWDIYPRPLLVREKWQSLNGEWTLNGVPCRVPSCRCEQELVYERSFEFTRENRVVLLHFGAADQICSAELNGVSLGTHRGGYLPFSFDISGAVREGENRLTVRVTDTLSELYPYGKQSKNPKGMWYTPFSGLWQTVWLEQVPKLHIREIDLEPGLDYVDIEVKASEMTENAEPEISLIYPENQAFTLKRLPGTEKIRLIPENPRHWTPEDPFLYRISVSLGEDRAESYFALRTLGIRQASENLPAAFLLNGRPVFLHGVLDQGYFKQGLCLPEDPLEYERDVLRMKALGFNTLRKHIKIEPQCFYYACDRLGMLVIQDMVNSGHYSFFRDSVLGTLGIRLSDTGPAKSTPAPDESERRSFWLPHTAETVRHLKNHPCIAAWTLFNEGWGQFQSDRAYETVKSIDPSRPVDSASGWFAQEKSDFDSPHIYFRTVRLKPKKRPLLLSECGGYTLELSGSEEGGSRYAAGKKYGYGSTSSVRELTGKIISMYEKMVLPAVGKGCCGCIYTQLSDVENEINGLYTYDRARCKVETEPLLDLAQKLKENVKGE